MLAGLALVAAAGAGGSPIAGGAGKAKGPARILLDDTAATANPVPVWGEIECESGARHQFVGSDGDPHPTLTGAVQGNSAYRRLSVLDGDDFYGERCELGDNNRGAPTAIYREGQRRITALSLRLPPGYPLEIQNWQVVMQMKQATPAANSGGSPVLELQAYLGRWRLNQSNSRRFSDDSHQLWSAPAQIGAWTRFIFDVRYSRHARNGLVRVKADLNGDNDSLDPGERSRRFRTFTLKTEIPGGESDGARPGSSLPSHLRAGIYHDPAISCPAPQGCQVELDNVQVLAP